MSRIRSPFSIRFSPVAIAAAVVLLGSTAVASAQYYDQGPSYSQGAPQDQYAQTDPPDRAARLAYISGDVEFAPAGESDWGSADINRPMVTGDRLLTGDDGRAALELGDAALRINHDSAFNFLDLDDTTTQVELSQGTLNLRVRRLGDGQVYEIDTPTVAFIAGEPGTYRVDVAPNGNGAMVTVFEGSGTVYGENGASRPVQAGQSYRFDDSTLANVAVQRLPPPDDFDRFCGERDSRYANSVSRRYVSEGMVGYDDLDRYGDWQDTPDYGAVWYPTQVAAGWAPYRDGHWAWIEPWGWTWVDDEPWGYAPFHYGRWVYVRSRWGWMPGPRTVRPVYAPALVAFVGGSGFSISIGVGGGGGYGSQPVGWFPLGPRDVYVPPYRASRNYFTNVNVTNIRNVYVNKTVINNYYGNYAAGRPYAGAREYAYRNNPRAFTAVPRNVFASAKPVRPAVLRVKPNVLARATVTPIPHVAPTRASLAIKPPKRPIAKPVARAFDRTVVARHAPPARPVPFAAREKVIAKQGGAPIPVAQLQKMRQQHAKAQPERVRVVAPAAKPGAPARAGQPVVAPRQQPTAPQEQRKGERPRASIHPIQVPVNPPKGASRNAPRQEPQRPGELPSARFAHPQRGAAPPAEQRATQNQQRSEQQRANRQQQAEQAQQRTEQERANRQQQAEQAQQRTEQERANRQQQQARQEQQRADQARQRAEQERANRQQQQAQQAQQRTEQERANRQRQQAQQEQQRAEQERANRQRQKAEQEQQRADQARQRAEQERANRQQQQQAQQEQQRADQARQRAEQERANRQQRQAQQEQQRAEQERSDRQRQHAQQDQQRARQAQMQQQREAQVRAQEQQRASQARTQQQRQQHAPPPPQERKKKKDHDQQDNGGH